MDLKRFEAVKNSTKVDFAVLKLLNVIFAHHNPLKFLKSHPELTNALGITCHKDYVSGNPYYPFVTGIDKRMDFTQVRLLATRLDDFFDVVYYYSRGFTRQEAIQRLQQKCRYAINEQARHDYEETMQMYIAYQDDCDPLVTVKPEVAQKLTHADDGFKRISVGNLDGAMVNLANYLDEDCSKAGIDTGQIDDERCVDHADDHLQRGFRHGYLTYDTVLKYRGTLVDFIHRLVNKPYRQALAEMKKLPRSANRYTRDNVEPLEVARHENMTAQVWYDHDGKLDPKSPYNREAVKYNKKLQAENEKKEDLENE